NSGHLASEGPCVDLKSRCAESDSNAPRSKSNQAPRWAPDLSLAVALSAATTGWSAAASSAIPCRWSRTAGWEHRFPFPSGFRTPPWSGTGISSRRLILQAEGGILLLGEAWRGQQCCRNQRGGQKCSSHSIHFPGWPLAGQRLIVCIVPVRRKILR